MDSKEKTKMAPFNNYCIICDKQIIPNPDHISNKLYCSESCQSIDRSFLRSHIKNVNTNKIPNVTNVNDTIITNPLLLPSWQEQNSSEDNIPENQPNHPFLITANIHKNNNIYHTNDFMIPNFNDNVAENNYKIWLNNI